VAPGGDGSATLWDLRVDSSVRGRGFGTALFDAAARWARDRGGLRIEVETQDVNVPACRFYARRGCELVAARRGAYPELPGEVQLLWSKQLA
jgi:GNAT superfamily N-acetyltransferase